MVTHLPADPHEQMFEEGELGCMLPSADNMRRFVLVQVKLREFFVAIPDSPLQEGSSLSAGKINYYSLKTMKELNMLNMLKTLEKRFPVGG